VIEECEKDPERLGKQALQARFELIECYQGLEDPDADSAIEGAKDCFWKVFQSETVRTKAFLDVAFLVGKKLVQHGNHAAGEKIFHAIESSACEERGPDKGSTIYLLIRIGSLYQDEDRWDDAEPRFEQALAASMTRNGVDDKLTKRLVEAIENRRYVSAALSATDFEKAVSKRGRVLEILTG
jgi:hypothetical protein